MKFNLNRMMAGLVMISGLLPMTTQAADMNSAQKQQVQGVVHDYIVQNPEVIVESLQSWQQKQMMASVQQTQNSSLQYADQIFHQSNDPVAGNPKGKVTVVEFFDYQCPHCVEMSPIFDNLVKNNPNVRVVFKEFPIRGPASEVAARAALAAAGQGKYLELHNALMDVAGKAPLTEEIIYKTAGKVGLDVDKLKVAMKSSAINDQIKANYQLAQNLKLMGTPAIFIAGSNVNAKSPASAIVFIPGQVDADQLNKNIQKVSG
ncbi:MAG: DsbA family protein [Gammaproteobacteria bacterium]|nr:DsbA family protein [Gammaproteobacteria bacterium]